MVKFFGELIRPIEAMKENLNLIEIIEEIGIRSHFFSQVIGISEVGFE